MLERIWFGSQGGHVVWVTSAIYGWGRDWGVGETPRDEALGLEAMVGANLLGGFGLRGEGGDFGDAGVGEWREMIGGGQWVRLKAWRAGPVRQHSAKANRKFSSGLNAS